MSENPKISIVGEVRRLYTSKPFTDAVTGLPVDPTTVSCIIKNPAGIARLMFGVAPELVDDLGGNFHVDCAVNLAGKWIYAFESTGVGEAADEQFFTARARQAI